MLSRHQEWAQMDELITDDVLDTFAVSGSPAQVAAAIRHRFDDVVTRVSLYTPYQADPRDLAATTAALRCNGQHAEPNHDQRSGPPDRQMAD